MKYVPIIGLEIHAQLNTKSKMFCPCDNNITDKKPNENSCPICLGHPGTLPVINKEAVLATIKTGLSCNCQINNFSKFDRKHYFYPDLPKGFQISQYDLPLCFEGYLEVSNKKIPIVRIHLEEDSGKLTHMAGGTLVDFNRAGTPLMELVTAPLIPDAASASEFCKLYQQILRYLEVSNADMEKGEMRCEANISLQEPDSFTIEGGEVFAKKDKNLNAKVEVKNINSFRSVEKAILYEIERQAHNLNTNQEIVQETRGWDDIKNKTVSQRVKESAKDYRYFPEPDLPPLEFSDSEIEEIKGSITELPTERRKRFMKVFKLSEQDARELTDNKSIGNYFENVISEAKEWIQALDLESEEVTDKDSLKVIKLTSNYIQTDLFKYLKNAGLKIEDCKITPENFAELMVMIKDNKISSSAARFILKTMFETAGDPSQIAEEHNLSQENDTEAISQIARKVIENNPETVEDFKQGKNRALNFLVGQVMKESRGKANPETATKIITEELKSL